MPNPWQVGIAVTDITPRPGLTLGGGALGKSTSVLHRLHAKALSLRYDHHRVLIITCDLLGFEWDYALSVRRRIARHCRIPVNAILLACTHTHSAPASVPLRNWGQPDPAYRASLRRQLTDLAGAAIADESPAGLSAGSARCPGVAVIRMRGLRSPVDDTLTALRVEDLRGRPRALLVNFACHPVNLHRTGVISPDFPHFVERELQRRLGRRTPVIYVSCCGGDLNPANFDPSDGDRRAPAQVRHHTARARHTGTKIAHAVRILLPRLKPILPVPPVARMHGVRVALQPLPDAKWLRARITEWKQELAHVTDRRDTSWKYTGVKTRLEWAREALAARRRGRPPRYQVIPIQTFRIGTVAVTGLPGEPFTAVGRAIRRGSPFRHTVIVSLANGCFGYFPTPIAYDRGSYEAVACPRYIGLRSFTPAVASRITAGTLQALRSVRRPAARPTRAG